MNERSYFTQFTVIIISFLNQAVLVYHDLSTAYLHLFPTHRNILEKASFRNKFVQELKHFNLLLKTSFKNSWKYDEK